METGITQLYQLPQTVFTFDELALIWQKIDASSLKSRINYYIKKNSLSRIRKGIYVKPEYNPLEAATKIYTPAYISLETVFRQEGMIFQYYDQVFAVSYLSREIECLDGLKIIYRKLKDEILINEKGIEKRDGYYIASPERAFMDAIYLNKNYYFDNLRDLDWGKCFSLVDIYRQKNMRARLESYYENRFSR